MLIYCKSCGTESPEGSQFCAKCGSSLDSMPPPISEPIKPLGQRILKKVELTLAVILVLVCVVAAWRFNSQDVSDAQHARDEARRDAMATSGNSRIDGACSPTTQSEVRQIDDFVVFVQDYGHLSNSEFQRFKRIFNCKLSHECQSAIIAAYR